jgi:molybdenum cofactor biosynthesis enzyme MoaA
LIALTCVLFNRGPKAESISSSFLPLYSQSVDNEKKSSRSRYSCLCIDWTKKRHTYSFNTPHATIIIIIIIVIMKGTSTAGLLSTNSRRLVGRRWNIGNNSNNSHKKISCLEQTTATTKTTTTTTRFGFHTTTTAQRRQESASSSSSQQQLLLPRLDVRRTQQQRGLLSKIMSPDTTTKRYLSSSSFSSNRSLSSSAVEVIMSPEEEEEEEEEENYGDGSCDIEPQQQQLELRPRLHALRQRLLDENIPSGSRSSGVDDDSILSLQQGRSSNSKSSSCSSCSSSTATSPPPSSSVVKVQHHHISNQQLNNESTISSSSSLHRLTPITKSTDLETIDTMDLLRRLEEMEEAKVTTSEIDGDSSSSSLLQDSFGRQHDYLRISLTERCNLRCTYCMPEAGVALQPAEHLLQTPELLHLASHFYHHLGVNKFRLTGGEPTLRHDLVQIVQGLSSFYNNNNDDDDSTSSSSTKRGKPQIGMTTNGIVLAKHLPALYEAGLTSVNVSLDTLHADKFAALTRRPAAYLDRVIDVIEMLTTQEPYKSNIVTKINCVVQRNVNDNELVDFVKHFCQDRRDDIASRRNLHAIRFIEYMPFTENGWDLKKLVPHHEMLQILQEQHNGRVEKLVPTDPHDTTKWYSASGGASTTTKVGFITSMSNHFCAGCNRLRLTADGQLQVCLFGTNGRNGRVSLRDALRATTTTTSDDGGQEGGVSPRQLNLLINYALSRKHYKLGGHESPTDIMKRAGANNRPMTLIGG